MTVALLGPEPDRLLPCEAARRALSEALGEPEIPVEARRHLDGCAACRREADSLRRLAGRLRALPVPEPPAAFWEDLPRRVTEQVWARRARPSWALAALAAAAALLLAIIPADRDRWTLGSAGGWLSELAATDSWLDPLVRARSPEEAGRLGDRVTQAVGFGPGAVRHMAWAVDEAVVRQPETSAWTLLDSLEPRDLERVFAQLEKGAGG